MHCEEESQQWQTNQILAWPWVDHLLWSLVSVELFLLKQSAITINNRKLETGPQVMIQQANKYCKIIHICAVIKMNIRYAYHRVVPKKLLVWLYVCVFPRIISDCSRNTTKIPTELITSESPLHKYIIPAETKSVAFILFEPLNKLA